MRWPTVTTLVERRTESRPGWHREPAGTPRIAPSKSAQVRMKTLEAVATPLEWISEALNAVQEQVDRQIELAKTGIASRQHRASHTSSDCDRCNSTKSLSGSKVAAMATKSRHHKSKSAHTRHSHTSIPAERAGSTTVQTIGPSLPDAKIETRVYSDAAPPERRDSIRRLWFFQRFTMQANHEVSGQSMSIVSAASSACSAPSKQRIGGGCEEAPVRPERRAKRRRQSRKAVAKASTEPAAEGGE
jgi:hypothetical protein